MGLTNAPTGRDAPPGDSNRCGVDLVSAAPICVAGRALTDSSCKNLRERWVNVAEALQGHHNISAPGTHTEDNPHLTRILSFCARKIGGGEQLPVD